MRVLLHFTLSLAQMFSRLSLFDAVRSLCCSNEKFSVTVQCYYIYLRLSLLPHHSVFQVALWSPYHYTILYLPVELCFPIVKSKLCTMKLSYGRSSWESCGTGEYMVTIPRVVRQTQILRNVFQRARHQLIVPLQQSRLPISIILSAEVDSESFFACPIFSTARAECSALNLNTWDNLDVYNY